MKRTNTRRIIPIIIAILAAIAVTQELRKPKTSRTWHGKVLLIPYDFRKPTLERIKETYWNPYERHVMVPTVFGLGWAVNLHSLLENLGLIHQPDPSEESFLIPGKRMKEILRP